MAKTKALISFAVTAKLICVFAFAYAKNRFSHDALVIHAKITCRKRGLVEKLLSRWLCVSYKRMKEIKSAVANSVCMQYERGGCVCPSSLKNDLL